MNKIEVHKYKVDLNYKFGSSVEFNIDYPITDTTEFFAFPSTSTKTGFSTSENATINSLGGKVTVTANNTIQVSNKYPVTEGVTEWYVDVWVTDTNEADNGYLFVKKGSPVTAFMPGVDTVTLDISAIGIVPEKTVPIITGIETNSPSTKSNLTAVAYLDPNNPSSSLIVERGGDTSEEVTVTIQLIEFQGDWSLETIIIDETAQTGSAQLSQLTLNNQELFFHQFKMNNSLTDGGKLYNLAPRYWLDQTTNTVNYAFDTSFDATTAGIKHVIYVLQNPNLATTTINDVVYNSYYNFYSAGYAPAKDRKGLTVISTISSNSTSSDFSAIVAMNHIGEKYNRKVYNYTGNPAGSAKFNNLIVDFNVATEDGSNQQITYEDKLFSNDLAFYNTRDITTHYYTKSNSPRNILTNQFGVGTFTLHGGMDYDLTTGEIKNTDAGGILAASMVMAKPAIYFWDGAIFNLFGMTITVNSTENDTLRSIFFIGNELTYFHVFLDEEAYLNVEYQCVAYGTGTTPDQYIPIFETYRSKAPISLGTEYHLLYLFEIQADACEGYYSQAFINAVEMDLYKSSTRTFDYIVADCDNVLAPNTSMFVNGTYTNSSFAYGRKFDYLSGTTNVKIDKILIKSSEYPVLYGADEDNYTFYEENVKSIVNTVAINALTPIAELAQEQGNGECQASLNDFTNNILEEANCYFKIPAPLNGGDLTLEFENIKYSSKDAVHIIWEGTGTLTAVISFGGDVPVNIISTNGGPVQIKQKEYAAVSVFTLNLDGDSNYVVRSGVNAATETGVPAAEFFDGVLYFEFDAHFEGEVRIRRTEAPFFKEQELLVYVKSVPVLNIDDTVNVYCEYFGYEPESAPVIL